MKKQPVNMLKNSSKKEIFDLDNIRSEVNILAYENQCVSHLVADDRNVLPSSNIYRYNKEKITLMHKKFNLYSIDISFQELFKEFETVMVLTFTFLDSKNRLTDFKIKRSFPTGAVLYNFDNQAFNMLFEEILEELENNNEFQKFIISEAVVDAVDTKQTKGVARKM